MFKNCFTILLIIAGFSFAKAQIPSNTLLAIPSYTTAEINATTVAREGSLAFDADQKKLFKFDGTSWKELLTAPPTISPKTGNYTLTAADNYSVLTFDSATDVTLTIPTGLQIGFNVSIYQIGAGQVIISGGGTTIKNRLSRFKTAGLDAGAGIISTATDIFHVTGDLKK